MRLLLDKRSSNGRKRRAKDGYFRSQVLLVEWISTSKKQSREVCVVYLYTIHHHVSTRREDLVDDDC
jgi:hypothetical protein